MKATMSIIPGNKDVADKTGSTFVASSQAVVSAQNEAITSFGIDPDAKIAYGEMVVHCIVSSFGNENWAINGVPKKLAGDNSHPFPTLWPVRYFERTKSGDSFGLTINGHQVTVTAGDDTDTASLTPTFEEGIADVMSHKEFVQAMMDSNAISVNSNVNYVDEHRPHDLPAEYLDGPEVGCGDISDAISVAEEEAPVIKTADETPAAEQVVETEKKSDALGTITCIGAVVLACAAAYFLFKK